MTSVTIYHNPRCSKSRETLALLKEKGISPNIVLYCEERLSVETLDTLVKQLGFQSARELMRRSESLYQTLDLDRSDCTEAYLLQIMHEHPQLIERPIVVYQQRAKLGRPPAQVLALFESPNLL